MSVLHKQSYDSNCTVGLLRYCKQPRALNWASGKPGHERKRMQMRDGQSCGLFVDLRRLVDYFGK